MKLLDNYITKKIKKLLYGTPKDHVDDYEVKSYPTGSGLAIRSSETVDADCIAFKMFQANGGFVVEVRELNNYDSTARTVAPKLHLITSDQNLGEALAHIITYTFIKR